MNDRPDTSLPEGRKYTVSFDQLHIEDIARVGGKNASLGEMYQALTPKGVRIPDGFAITSEGYWHFIRSSGLDTTIDQILQGLNTDNMDNLQRKGKQVRQAILSAEVPDDLQAEILDAYARLGGPQNLLDVAVRSSATAEDLPGASFAGQQETFLNVRGNENLLRACIRSYASLFTDRAISYRCDMGFSQTSIALSIGIQRMVRSDLAASGVMFTIDTESGFPDVVLINAAYGLGESIVQGAVNPDEYCVFKPTLWYHFRPIIRKIAGSKECKLIYDNQGGNTVQSVPVPEDERALFAIDDDDILQLSQWACLIEEHYSCKAGAPTPMDIEWAKDGPTGSLYILQARPETVQSRKQQRASMRFALKGSGKVLASGRSVGSQIAAGPVKILQDASSLNEFRQGDILVADKTDPDWEPIMKKASAIVTNRGGRTCHAAIISRELGVPAVVGTNDATSKLQDGQSVTVSCAEGDRGVVLEGRVPFEVIEETTSSTERPRTKVMLNIADPEQAFKLSFLPNDGVGLARMEFIISNHIRIHPMALLACDEGTLQDAAARASIEALTLGHPTKAAYFVDRLAQGVATIAAAFYPKDVILRFSDFKTNEYANLIGGREFEPLEENPMLGFRGASRYYHPRYQGAFALECKAVQIVRQSIGLANLKVMVPFCRTVEEAGRVLQEMAKHGLRRGEHGLEIYVMCEIPSNVILAEQFAALFDGMSIGSNDLTQLVLGVDRDSEILAPLFDERNAAVKHMISSVIATCHEVGTKVGICGQAPSDYPDFARFLVQQGIDSISLNPDAVAATTAIILKQEGALYDPPSRPPQTSVLPTSSHL